MRMSCKPERHEWKCDGDFPPDGTPCLCGAKAFDHSALQDHLACCGQRQCECVNENHAGGRCTNVTHMHHFCGPCQSEGAKRMEETPLQKLGRLLTEAGAIPMLSMTADEWRSVLAQHTAELTERAERAENAVITSGYRLRTEARALCRRIDEQARTIDALRANLADANADFANLHGMHVDALAEVEMLKSSATDRATINVNHYIYFTLTEAGRAFVRDYFLRLYVHDKEASKPGGHVDRGVEMYNGGKAQIHDFMNMFGPAMTNGGKGPDLFVERTTFEIECEPRIGLLGKEVIAVESAKRLAERDRTIESLGASFAAAIDERNKAREALRRLQATGQSIIDIAKNGMRE